MLNAQVLTTLVELRLKLMAIVGLDGMNAEREFFSYTVHKINGILLAVPVVNVQHPGSGGVVDCGVLEALYLLPSKNIREEQKLHIHLNTVAGHLLFIALKRFHGAPALILRQAV